MIIKRGNIVSHAVAVEWGIGKVVEVTDVRATIEFADGTLRKIASSHFGSLLLTDPAFFVPASVSVPAVKVPAAAKKPKKVKAPAPE